MKPNKFGVFGVGDHGRRLAVQAQDLMDSAWVVRSSGKKPTVQRDNKAMTRMITAGSWMNPEMPGPNLFVNVDGTDHPIGKDFDPVLASVKPVSLKLQDQPDKYFDLSYASRHRMHTCKTFKREHFHAAAEAIIARCPDLKFEVDDSNGRWTHKVTPMLVNNVATNQVGLIGTVTSSRIRSRHLSRT